MRRWAGIATVALMAAGGGAALQAASLGIYPMRIVLTPKQAIKTMVIHNAGTETTRVQLRLFAWRQVNGEDVLEETQDVLTNPPLFQIGPGGDQIARFGLRTSPGAVEKSYRVILQEVPDARPAIPGQIRTLLRISIPIFVPAANGAAHLAWKLEASGGRQVALVARDDGTAHVQITRLTLTSPSGAVLARTGMSAYLLPGTTRRMMVDTAAPVAPGEPVRLAADTDQAIVPAEIVRAAAANEAARP